MANVVGNPPVLTEGNPPPSRPESLFSFKKQAQGSTRKSRSSSIHDESAALQCVTRTHTIQNIDTSASWLDPSYQVDFADGDKSNPKNWSLWYRCLIIFSNGFATWVVILYSTCYTSGVPGMIAEFEIKNRLSATAGVTTYLVGVGIGALFFAPASEVWGRKYPYIGGMAVFTIMVLPCALAKNLATVVICRFIGGFAGATMLCNAPGTLIDISNERNRALAFSLWSIGPLNAPVTGPLIGGFVYEYIGWRWTNWIVLILSGVSWILLAILEETYAPTILKKKVAERNGKHGNSHWCQYEDRRPLSTRLKETFGRPFAMMWSEPILWFWDIYLGLIWGTMYLCFISYPIIFTEEREFSNSPGVRGLVFLGIGLGTCVAIACEPLLRRLIANHKKEPKTGRPPPEASVSIICAGALLVPIGQLIFSWTSLPGSIHWAVSVLAGIPFGAGNTIIFVYTSSYIAGCYGNYTTSAMAGNTLMRCAIGGLLPLAGRTMFHKLTPQWAGTLLALMTFVSLPIPCSFYKWGALIREKSPLIRKMREEEARNARKRERGERRIQMETLRERGELGEDMEPGREE